MFSGDECRLYLCLAYLVPRLCAWDSFQVIVSYNEFVGRLLISITTGFR